MHSATRRRLGNRSSRFLAWLAVPLVILLLAGCASSESASDKSPTDQDLFLVLPHPPLQIPSDAGSIKLTPPQGNQGIKPTLLLQEPQNIVSMALFAKPLPLFTKGRAVNTMESFLLNQLHITS